MTAMHQPVPAKTSKQNVTRLRGRGLARTQAVILAGGRGTRLAPYTSILPKPLMPIGDRAVLEVVVDQLSACGVRRVTFCVGYLAHLIRAVFDQRANGEIEIGYSYEHEALGTAAPLRLVEGLDETFIVMNGDVLTKLDQYDGRGSFAGWVRSITVTRCLMQLRSPWRRGLRLIASAGPERHSAECEPAARDDSQLGLDLERALDRLGETARPVVWLHDVEGYTHAEIGTLLGGTPSLSKSQLARAHERLRALLEPSGVLHPCTPVSTIC